VRGDTPHPEGVVNRRDDGGSASSALHHDPLEQLDGRAARPLHIVDQHDAVRWTGHRSRYVIDLRVDEAGLCGESVPRGAPFTGKERSLEHVEPERAGLVARRLEKRRLPRARRGVIHERAASTGRGALEEVSKLGELDVSTYQAALHAAVLARKGNLFLALGSNAEMLDDARPSLGAGRGVRHLAPSEGVEPTVDRVPDRGSGGHARRPTTRVARARVPQVLDRGRARSSGNDDLGHLH
jgi:hypothetical protein